ncbi:enoyl-CoA hydratase [Chitinophaga sp. Mgbs1]|uniref:Enoyl-CoA hydratase n=1 Tax=Chitinophaga solisilvae TaxID=1233460 RepID=A0A433WJH2_9BACT|nr:enoyl-CoA hydratase [Chitinophaga solisilvae]
MSYHVVELREIEPGIVQLTMQDRTFKNAFSDNLISELASAFEEVSRNTSFKVVILTGYDSYFCSGGTQDGILSIANGKARFTDFNVYALPLECDIPVIAAMQGHSIGGGFVFGMFADFVVMSLESVYTTNFMRYGFTPGMGATYIVPKKLGISLGTELLLSAGNYRGGELLKRGVPFPVVPRNEVLKYALQTARLVTDMPRVSLVTLKQHLVADMKKELNAVVDKELVMHEKTFQQEEVKNRIITLYGK